jgi:capsular polysaccharide biosynthesis protein
MSNGCIFELKCPNSYNSYPRITEIAKMPDHVRATLNVLWERSIHQGRDLQVFARHNVFVAEEGLVFDQDRKLMPESRTYHSDDEIQRSINNIELLQKSGDIRVLDKAILTKSRGATNYGHSILEMLPRAWFVRKNLNVPGWPALIHDSGSDLTTIMQEALSFAGFSGDEVLTSDGAPILVENLLVVDGLASHTQYLSPYVMSFLDEITESIPAAGEDKIYVNRGSNASRDFAEEGVVSSELSKLGYVPKFTGHMSFRDQVAAFRGADSIVGVLGAALSNIAFCKPGTEINCFMPSEACEVLFWMLAERRNLKYHEVRCAEEGPQRGPLPWDRHIRVPIDQLRKIV